jgi:hypothetical protein
MAGGGGEIGTEGEEAEEKYSPYDLGERRVGGGWEEGERRVREVSGKRRVGG